MPQETCDSNKLLKKDNRNIPSDLQAHMISPRASVAFSFLASLRWLKMKFGILFARRTHARCNPQPTKFANKLG